MRKLDLAFVGSRIYKLYEPYVDVTNASKVALGRACRCRDPWQIRTTNSE